MSETRMSHKRVFPNCMHCCQSTWKVHDATEKQVEDALRSAFDSLKGLSNFHQVPSKSLAGQVFMGEFTTPKCGWVDRIFFDIGTVDGYVEVKVDARSRNACCAAKCPSFVLFCFSWLRCFDDHGMNHWNTQRIFHHVLTQSNLRAEMKIDYVSRKRLFVPRDQDNSQDEQQSA
eukprot:TRINITY_DN32974_c0_g1_i2.p1 TRINITY_DN32974_c0_g1~~TRINITY_DN32974_c0_g1_i2.p1  ORF type:complete len:174 (+),score=67.15 TRINITY_DN32974_c0_g1_i2:144-665(+)